MRATLDIVKVNLFYKIHNKRRKLDIVSVSIHLCISCFLYLEISIVEFIGSCSHGLLCWSVLMWVEETSWGKLIQLQGKGERDEQVCV